MDMEGVGYTLLAIGVALVAADLILGWGLAFDLFGVAGVVAGAILLLLAEGEAPAWLTPLLIAVGGFVLLSNVASVFRVRNHAMRQEAALAMGKTAVVREPLTPFGTIALKGEQFDAVITRGSAREGDEVKVVGAQGRRLMVEKPATPPAP